MRSAKILGMISLLVCGCGPRTLPHENRTVEELRAMLEDAEPRVQAQGALGLSLHGPDGREAVPRLTELLGSNDVNVRQQAALALGKIGPDAKPAEAALERALADSDWALRRQAAIALGGIGDPRARKALEKLRNDRNKLVQQAAREALAKLSGEPNR